MYKSNNLILNFITKDYYTNKRNNITSLRSKLKNVGGSWKEKKKIRKLLKKNLQKHSLDNPRKISTEVTASNNNSIQENNSNNTNYLNSKKNLNDLNNKAQVIS